MSSGAPRPSPPPSPTSGRSPSPRPLPPGPPRPLPSGASDAPDAGNSTTGALDGPSTASHTRRAGRLPYVTGAGGGTTQSYAVTRSRPNTSLGARGTERADGAVCLSATAVVLQLLLYDGLEV